MSNNPAKYEVLIKQYLRSILDISGFLILRFRLGVCRSPFDVYGLYRFSFRDISERNTSLEEAAILNCCTTNHV